MNPYSETEQTEIEAGASIPSFTSSFTACKTPSGVPTPALSNVTCINNGTNTTIYVVVAVDSNFTVTSNNLVNYVTPDPISGGKFELIIAAPTRTQNFLYYSLKVIIVQTYTPGDSFDIAYATGSGGPGPRTIRGTVTNPIPPTDDEIENEY